VLGVELGEGREDDPLVRAVTSIIAAQLSTVVTGLPAAAASATAARSG